MAKNRQISYSKSRILINKNESDDIIENKENYDVKSISNLETSTSFFNES